MSTDTDVCNFNNRSISAQRYGVGKGLMTIWHATNPGGGSPVGLSSFDRGIAQKLMFSNTTQENTSGGLYTQHRRKRATKIIRNKVQEKRKCQQKRTKAVLNKCNKNNPKQQLFSVDCGLLVGDLKYHGLSKSLTILMDDEELELSEARAGPNPFGCSEHFTSSGRNCCPLCKDMLGRFPPPSVNMNHPICSRPWVSSPEMVKKLFKVFRFLHTCSDKINICPFTLDEFAQSFQEKDSMLLGKVHICLLKILLSKLHVGISSGFRGASKDCRFIGFMHSVKQRDFDVAFWTQSLNALTWTEILRQVSVAAGYGSTRCSPRKEALHKEDNDMAKYGLCPRTLKGELFCILSNQGSRGSKVSDLARASQIVALGISSTCDDLEYLISSTLSSDVTLFEKISTSAFRLRTCLLPKVEDITGSESDDSGSISNHYFSSSAGSSSDESDQDPSELDSSLCVQSIASYKGLQKMKCKSASKIVEIDESFSGESWLLGLIEGDYSDLSIEEKLDALVALVNLTSSALCMSIDASVAIFPNVCNANKHRSGAKVKKVPSHVLTIDSVETSMEFHDDHSVDSKQRHGGDTQKGRLNAPQQHPLRAVNLGSDRRFNSYWLFLGPCEEGDPGHRRVYFESSEDGHWEVIDTKQALSSLLSALDSRGVREAHLFTSLERRKEYLIKAMTRFIQCETGVRQERSTESPDSDIISGNGSSLVSDMDNNIVSGECTTACAVSHSSLMTQTHRKCTDRDPTDQLDAFDKWIWNSFCGSLNAVKCQKSSHHDTLAHCSRCHDLFWRDEKHCTICHTTFELDFDLDEKYTIHKASCELTLFSSSTYKVLPSKLQALKAAIYAIEAVIPVKALFGWTKTSHNLWRKRLRRTSSLHDLFQVVKDLVGALNQDWSFECASNFGSNVLNDTIIQFQSMPQTTAAFALWMVQLDNLLASHLKMTTTHDDVSMPQ